MLGLGHAKKYKFWDRKEAYLFRLSFLFRFLFCVGGEEFPFSTYDLKALAEVEERKQCMKNGYIPTCGFLYGRLCSLKMCRTWKSLKSC